MGSGFHELDAGALSCFRQAATSCGEASLLVTESGVDAGSSSLVALHRVNSACAVSMTVQSYVLTRTNPITRLDCGPIRVDAGGETVTCGKGETISIPAHAG